MLLLNRRGYANYIACPDHRCGWMMRCNHCDATVVYHKNTSLPTGGYVRCHHCDAEQLLVTTCPDSGHKISIFGLGTQKVEEEIIQKFPGVRVARMDSDTMRNARDYQRTLDGFRAGEIDVLLGTQMIAKGLDFPGVRLVGVISADTALHLPDFRASERTFQLISQVAGRSGRSEHPGRVVVQTFSPDDPAIILAAAHDYETFAHREIALPRSAYPRSHAWPASSSATKTTSLATRTPRHSPATSKPPTPS
jgi:primosomal protein N' (replication factor Y)